MVRVIEFGDISTLLDDMMYPLERSAGAEAFSDFTLVLAEGQADLGKLISETASETFESAAAIETARHHVLPREAVGEPYQSDGDA